MSICLIVSFKTTQLFRTKVNDPAELPSLEAIYDAFLGGLPEDAVRVPGSITSESPYIGCIRDVHVGEKFTDFNTVSYSNGVEMGICKEEITVMPGKILRYFVPKLMLRAHEIA